MRRLRLAGIGCGNRTLEYLTLAAAMPTQYEVVAAADPMAHRVERVRRIANNPNFRGFDSDRAILAEPKLADVMIVGTQDNYHYAPCLAAMEKGYDILLEKPIAQTLDEVLKLEAAALRLKRRVLVCHVLRYTPFYRKVREIVDSRMLGDVLCLNAVEGVDPFHQAHSFVRGYWAIQEKCTPMIIAKSCHDLDLIAWLMDRKCLKVSSFGARTYFTSAKKPAGAPPRCTDGCPLGMNCLYNALHYAGMQRFRLGGIFDGEAGATREEIVEWLKKSPWGRCVYQCDNTVVDHQAVAMTFAGDAVATFTMTAFEAGRHVEIFGTKASLRGGHFVKQETGSDIVVTEHIVHHQTRFSVNPMAGGYEGHAGGDPGLMLALYDEMMKDDVRALSSSISKSVESHVMGFAAEESRLTGRTIELEEFARRQR